MGNVEALRSDGKLRGEGAEAGKARRLVGMRREGEAHVAGPQARLGDCGTRREVHHVAQQPERRLASLGEQVRLTGEGEEAPLAADEWRPCPCSRSISMPMLTRRSFDALRRRTRRPWKHAWSTEPRQ